MHKMQDQFQQHCILVKLLPKRPNDEDLLVLYGLYKQSTIGDNTNVEPGMFSFETNRKWASWNKFKGMAKEEAMKYYVLKVQELISNI